MTGAREAILLEAANNLLDARRTTTPLADLPAELMPADQTEAYFVQDTIAEAYGPIGGWKVSAPTPDAAPISAPMPLAWIAPTGATLSAQAHRYRGLEAEIAFLLARDLPPRATPYTRDEVLAAIASCHPAIEVLESGLTDPTGATRLAMIADLQMHGGFVYGPGWTDWRSLDFAAEQVTLSVDGVIRVQRTGSPSFGDIVVRFLLWLANEGAARTGGLKAGQWITTGSWTGNVQAFANSTVDVHFARAGRVNLCFA